MKLRRIADSHYETRDGRHCLFHHSGRWYASAVVESGAVPAVSSRVPGYRTRRAAAAALGLRIAEERAAT